MRCLNMLLLIVTWLMEYQIFTKAYIRRKEVTARKKIMVTPIHRLILHPIINLLTVSNKKILLRIFQPLRNRLFFLLKGNWSETFWDLALKKYWMKQIFHLGIFLQLLRLRKIMLRALKNGKFLLFHLIKT